MELRNIDSELLFEKVTKVIYRRIEKPISIDGVDLRFQCSLLALFYGKPVGAAEQVIARSFTHGDTHTKRSSLTETSRSANKSSEGRLIHVTPYEADNYSNSAFSSASDGIRIELNADPRCHVVGELEKLFPSRDRHQHGVGSLLDSYLGRC